MKRPFGKLMDMLNETDLIESQITLGELAQLWDEPVERVMDAIDALKWANGELTYIEVR